MVIGEHHKAGLVRSPENEKLTSIVVRPWRKIVKLFKERPEMTMAGYGIAPPGFVWYNFFWVRASWVRDLVEPVVTGRRHYYEDWLSRHATPPPGVERNEEMEKLLEWGYSHGNNFGYSLCGNKEGELGVSYVAETLPDCTEFR